MKNGKHISTMAAVAFGIGLAVTAVPQHADALSPVTSAMSVAAQPVYRYPKSSQDGAHLTPAEHKELISLIEDPHTTPEALVKRMGTYSQPAYKNEGKYLIKARKEIMGDNFNDRATPAQAEQIHAEMEFRATIPGTLMIPVFVLGIAGAGMGGTSLLAKNIHKLDL